VVVTVCYGKGGFTEIDGENKHDSLGGGWCSKEVAGPFGVGVWKCIKRG
jgi:hypothetical protein